MKKMSLDELRIAMTCFLNADRNTTPDCLSCTRKKFCDGITLVMLAHMSPKPKAPPVESIPLPY